MSTSRLSNDRFATLQASLIHHTLPDLKEAFAGIQSCGHVQGELCRAFGLNPFNNTPQEITAKIKAIVFDWNRVNLNAYVARYEDERSKNHQPEVIRGRGKVLPLPALLKALRALRYNCDMGDASGDTLKQSLDVLEQIIDSLKDICLEMLPEYANAEWAI